MSLFKFVETPVITAIDGCIVSKNICNQISKGFVFGAILEQCVVKNEKQIALLEKNAPRLEELRAYIDEFKKRKQELVEKRQREHDEIMMVENEKMEEFKKNNDKDIEEKKKNLDNVTQIYDDILLQIKTGGKQCNRKELNEKLVEMREQICAIKKNIKELENNCEKYMVGYWKISGKSTFVNDDDVENYYQYLKIINEHDNIIDKICDEEEPLWRDILFFRVISKQDNNLTCSVEDLFFRETKAKFKIGDVISIEQKYISFVITNKYITNQFYISSYQTDRVTSWNGTLYSDANLVRNLISPNWIVRVQLRDKRRDTTCVWYMKILKREGEILYGFSLNNYKNQDEDFDYNSNFKCDCIYKFHINAVKEIPNWQEKEESNQLLNIYKTKFKSSVTGMELGTSNDEYIEV
jgi:hypothetical protein